MLSAGMARAQGATGALQVTVLEAGDDRASGAVVEVDGGSVRVEAGRDGRASFVHLRPGRHVVRAVLGPRAAEAEMVVAAGGTSRLTLWLPPSPAEASASSVGGSSFDRSTLFTDDDRSRGPWAGDPWSLLRSVPGVLVDRVDVAGSDSAQQSLVISRGDPGTGATWSLDGVDLTDAAALGTTSLYPDLDQAALVQVRTSALDVRVRTPGAQVSLYTRELGPRWSGRAHLRAAGPRSRNVPAELAGRSLVRNDTERVTTMGGELGGPVRGDRLRAWMAWGRDAVRQETFTGHEERLATSVLTARVQARTGAGTTSLVALRGEKTDEDRDPTLDAAPAARWRQSGPTRLLAVEDRRALGAISLLTRASYLDSGFRLEPQGGASASGFEDFHGVFQQSYQRFETRRPRLEAGAEAATTGRWLGTDHVLTAGAAYRRSVVRTQARWPGSEVVAFERQTVFFRAFDLTGFALPTRAQDARSVHGGWSAYLQDEARSGRLGLTLGLRLEQLSGHNLASSVDASPAFPALLPAVSYGGGPVEIRWRDLLPRAGASWDIRGQGAIVARLGYAAYAAPVGAAEVTFDNPLGQVASLTYYWIDRNGNHAVDAGELDTTRGRLGASGVDPAAPAAATTPNAIAASLRAPRTHEVTLALEHARPGGLHAVAQVSWRRLLHPLWRPLRGLTLSDYVIRGAVTGTLFGEPFNVGYYAPASLSRVVPGNGRVLDNHEGYRQDAWTAELAAEGRLWSHLRWDLAASATDWREYFTDVAPSLQDPTPMDTQPLRDGGFVAVPPGGLGRGDVFAQARWTASAGLAASLPWRLGASARLFARDGFPIPYFQVADTGDPTNAAKNVLVSPGIDAFRLAPLALLDARVERSVRMGRGTLVAGVDAFNVLNRATTLQVTRDVEAPSAGRPREILRPRMIRFGVEYRF
jgi:hypothetical protein